MARFVLIFYPRLKRLKVHNPASQRASSVCATLLTLLQSTQLPTQHDLQVSLYSLGLKKKSRPLIDWEMMYSPEGRRLTSVPTASSILNEAKSANFSGTPGKYSFTICREHAAWEMHVAIYICTHTYVYSVYSKSQTEAEGRERHTHRHHISHSSSCITHSSVPPSHKHGRPRFPTRVLHFGASDDYGPCGVPKAPPSPFGCHLGF